MKKRNLRQEILDATQRLIQTDGIMRLTTKEIAREAGCAEGTLFKYFRRKEDICLAVVLENAPRFRVNLACIRAGEGAVAANLASICMAAMDFFAKLIPLAGSLFSDINLLTRHREEMTAQGRGPQDVFALIAAYIEGEPRLRRIHASVSSHAIASLLLGPCFHRIFIRQALGRFGNSAGDRAFVEAVVESLVQGLNPAGDRIA